MSIISRIREAGRNLRAAFELSHLYPGARIAEQARAEQKDYEIRLRDLRGREAPGETYEQAMARMTGADPAGFEPEPPAGRTMTDIVNDRNAGRIGWAEYNRQEQARAAGLDDEAALEAEVRGAPQLDLTGADPAAFEPEPGRAEAEAALQAGEDEFADYWSGEGQDARRDLDAEDSDPDQEEEMTDEEAWQFRMEQKLEELEAAARPEAAADPGFTVPEDTGWGDEPLPRGFMGAPVPEDDARRAGLADYYPAEPIWEIPEDSERQADEAADAAVDRPKRNREAPAVAIWDREAGQ